MTPARHAYSTARTVTYTESGLAVIRIEGVITPKVSGEILRDYQTDITQAGTDASVAIYAGSALAVDAQLLLENAKRAMDKTGGLHVPTALVVDADTAAMWRNYAWLMAQNGVVRAVFTDLASAERWAQEKAPVFRALQEAARPQAEDEARSSQR